MRCTTAGALPDIAHDVLEAAEPATLMLMLLALLQAVEPCRRLQEANVVGNLKHSGWHRLLGPSYRPPVRVCG